MARLAGRLERATLLQVLTELARLYPDLRLIDQTKPLQGAFGVKDILAGTKFSILHEELPFEVKSFLQVPHWLWGMDDLGFISIWALLEEGRLVEAFKEEVRGLPVRRPPMVR